MHVYSFWYELDRGGAFFRFLLWFGGFFTGGCVTPPLPPIGGVFLGLLFVVGVVDSFNWGIFS